MTINAATNRARGRENLREIGVGIETKEIEEAIEIEGETEGMVEEEVEIEIEEIGGIDIGIRNSWSFLQPGG
ncbi:MAG: hypothetical protein J2P31_05635 [Blastocatellia bacterium]|nr:hypothetical protein [Blastocatellia bacterium]